MIIGKYKAEGDSYGGQMYVLGHAETEMKFQPEGDLGVEP